MPSTIGCALNTNVRCPFVKPWRLTLEPQEALSPLCFGFHLRTKRSVVSCITLSFIIKKSYGSSQVLARGKFISGTLLGSFSSLSSISINYVWCLNLLYIGSFNWFFLLFIRRARCSPWPPHKSNFDFLFFWISAGDGIIFHGVALVMQYGVFGLAILNTKAFAKLY